MIGIRLVVMCYKLFTSNNSILTMIIFIWKLIFTEILQHQKEIIEVNDYWNLKKVEIEIFDLLNKILNFEKFIEIEISKLGIPRLHEGLNFNQIGFRITVWDYNINDWFDMYVFIYYKIDIHIVWEFSQINQESRTLNLIKHLDNFT